VGLIPIYHGVISMSSSVGNCFSNCDLIAWSKQSSMHHMGGGGDEAGRGQVNAQL
jgi:hypothetical protein